MERIVRQFGKELRDYREKQGWSLRTLAGKADMAHTTIAQIENGITDPRLSDIKKLSKAFGEDVRTFLEVCGIE